MTTTTNLIKHKFPGGFENNAVKRWNECLVWRGLKAFFLEIILGQVKHDNHFLTAGSSDLCKWTFADAFPGHLRGFSSKKKD